MAFFSSRRQADSETTESENRIQPLPAPQNPIGFSTVLGANSDLEGKLGSEGNVRLDGKFTGTLDISGNVLIGETAQINADVDARNISIAGAVRGNVTGNKVQLLRTGRVWGDISASALMTEEGAFIDGRITMTGHAASQPTTIKTEKSDVASDIEANGEDESVDAEELIEAPVLIDEALEDVVDDVDADTVTVEIDDDNM
ncbi:MAG: bactofilin family protein [Aggregatilineales bacterium]